MIKNNSQNKGVTFIELIVAVAVLTIALLSLYLVMLYGIKVNKQAKNLAISYEIANKEMETVRNTPFANLVNQTNGNFYSDSASDLAKLNSGAGSLTIQDYGGTNQIKQIIITVTWTDTTTKTTTITSLTTSGGINK